ISANAHVKYESSLEFGAILICANPITQTAYNDEKLLRRWVAENKKELSVRHGSQLCRYGLFLVTKTYRTPQASINAWMEKDKEILLSAKAKEQLLCDDCLTLCLNHELSERTGSYMQSARRRMVWWFSLTGFGIRPGTGGGDRSSSIWGGGRGFVKKRKGRERQEGCCWRRSAQR